MSEEMDSDYLPSGNNLSKIGRRKKKINGVEFRTTCLGILTPPKRRDNKLL